MMDNKKILFISQNLFIFGSKNINQNETKIYLIKNRLIEFFYSINRIKKQTVLIKTG